MHLYEAHRQQLKWHIVESNNCDINMGGKMCRQIKMELISLCHKPCVIIWLCPHVINSYYQNTIIVVITNYAKARPCWGAVGYNGLWWSPPKQILSPSVKCLIIQGYPAKKFNVLITFMIWECNCAYILPLLMTSSYSDRVHAFC